MQEHLLQLVDALHLGAAEGVVRRDGLYSRGRVAWPFWYSEIGERAGAVACDEVRTVMRQTPALRVCRRVGVWVHQCVDI